MDNKTVNNNTMCRHAAIIKFRSGFTFRARKWKVLDAKEFT